MAEAARLTLGINVDSTDLGLSEHNADKRGKLDRDGKSAGRVTSMDAACNAERNGTGRNKIERTGTGRTGTTAGFKRAASN
jgi:hypothetical protein